MSDNRLPHVAVVGCGYWGKNLIRNFYELGSLTSICDVDESRLSEMQRLYPVRANLNFEDVLHDDEIEGVAIAAPAAQHFVLAKQAMLAGKDVFVEKPLALHLKEGEELVQLAAQHSRVLMVGHLLQYHPAVNELRRLIQAGELGKVEYISSSRLNFGKLRTEEDILWSFAPHDISAILYLLDEKPVQVAAQGASYLNHPTSDVTLTILNFASGVKAHFFVSWLHPFKEQKLVVVGSQKMAVFDDAQTHDKLTLYPVRIQWVNRVPVAHKIEGEAIRIEMEEPLRRECTHFLECVKNHTRPRTDGQNGLEVLRILHAAGQSTQTSGHPVFLGEKAQPRYFAHSSAVVDDPCEIGEGTKIWHFTHIMADSRIGNGCNIGQNVCISPHVKIGNGVKIQNNVSIYTGVELEDDVFCGPSAVFTNVLTPRSHINRKSEYRRTLVRKGASLGANSTIVCGVTIGRYAFVGAGSVVTRDVPDYGLVVGVPARRVGWVCQCGLRLKLSGDLGVCGTCGSAYVLSDGVLTHVPAKPHSTAVAQGARAAAGAM